MSEILIRTATVTLASFYGTFVPMVAVSALNADELRIDVSMRLILSLIGMVFGLSSSIGWFLWRDRQTYMTRLSKLETETSAQSIHLTNLRLLMEKLDRKLEQDETKVEQGVKQIVEAVQSLKK